jgi:hypothetical protein
VNEGDAGIAALGSLTLDLARRVVRQLAAADARQILSVFARRPGRGRPPVRQLWSWGRALPPDPAAEPGRWLTALLALERDGSGTVGGGTIDAIAALARLRAAELSHAWFAGSLDVETPLSSLRWLCRQVGVDDSWLAECNEGDPGLREIVADLAPSPPPSGRPGAGAAANSQREIRVRSRFGGGLVLLDLVTRLGWTQQWARTFQAHRMFDAESIARALALAVVARALAPRARRQVMSDPALRLAAGADDAGSLLRTRRRRIIRAFVGSGVLPSVGNRRLHVWQEETARALLAALAERLPGFDGSSPDFLRSQVLALSATVDSRGNGVRVSLGTAPLDVALAFGGYKSSRWSLPGGPEVQVSREEMAS